MSGLPDDDLASIARWLIAHLDAIRQHEAGGEAVDEITSAVRLARHAIDRPPDLAYAGMCGAPREDDPDCEEDLYARAGATTVTCRCGASFDLDDRRRWLLREAEDVLAIAAHIAQAVTALGRPVTPERVRQWASRGRLVPHGHDDRGRPLYRVGDVLDLLAREAS